MAELLRITGIIKDDVGTQRQHGLVRENWYDVPLALSRAATEAESIGIRRAWSSLKETLPRGEAIAADLHVSGDRLVIKRATIEEIRDTLARRLRAIIRQVNADTAEAERERLHREEEAARHRDRVELIAREIDWDSPD